MIPTLNEERNIGRCLRSIRRQQYASIEVIIVDNYSSDHTVDIARSCGARVEFNAIRNPEISKMIGLQSATGDFFCYLDADIELASQGWFESLLKPMTMDPEIVGSFPRFIPDPEGTAAARFLRYNPLELDPLLEFLCPPISKSCVYRTGLYSVHVLDSGNAPPIGICLYRTGVLRMVLHGSPYFNDIDVPLMLSEEGFRRFSYVESVGIYHRNISNIMDIVKRRRRNLNQVFLPHIAGRRYRYVSGLGSICRLAVWIVASNLMLPTLVRGIYRAIRFRDSALLLEPVVAAAVTDNVLAGILSSPAGRRFALRVLGILH